MVVNPLHKPVPHPPGGFRSFQAFYPFYLGEHNKRATKVLHVTGSTIAVGIYARLILALLAKLVIALSLTKRVDALKLVAKYSLTRKQVVKRLLLSLLQGYAFAWVAHFYVEHNRPATFKYPLWSLRGDFKMLWEVATLQRAL